MSSALGVDVSRYQLSINWSQVAAAGKKFSIMRATVGDGYRDPTYLANKNGAKAAGLVVGSYHVFKSSDNAESQAEAYWRMVGKLENGDIHPFLDVELLEPLPDAERVDLMDYCQALAMCVVHCEERFGKPIGIYTANWFWSRLPADQRKRFSHLPLWVASYGNIGTVTYPIGWTTYVIQQYSSTGNVPGISTNCDLNNAPDFSAIRRVIPPPDDWKARLETKLSEMTADIAAMRTIIRDAS